MKIGTTITRVCQYERHVLPDRRFTYEFNGGAKRLYCDDCTEPAKRTVQRVKGDDGKWTGERQTTITTYDVPRLGSLQVMGPQTGIEFSRPRAFRKVIRALHSAADDLEVDLRRWLHATRSAQPTPGLPPFEVFDLLEPEEVFGEPGMPGAVYSEVTRALVPSKERRFRAKWIAAMLGEHIGVRRSGGVDHTGSSNDTRAALEELVSKSDGLDAALPLERNDDPELREIAQVDHASDSKEPISAYREVFDEDQPILTKPNTFSPTFAPLAPTATRSFIQWVRVRLRAGSRTDRDTVAHIRMTDPLVAALLDQQADSYIKSALVQAAGERFIEADSAVRELSLMTNEGTSPKKRKE